MTFTGIRLYSEDGIADQLYKKFVSYLCAFCDTYASCMSSRTNSHLIIIIGYCYEWSDGFVSGERD